MTKFLIQPNEFGICADTHGTPMTTSYYIAQYFNKKHYNVIRDIQGLQCSKEFSHLNFELTAYTDRQGKERPCYNVTKDGFLILTMGYRGEKAMKIKEQYIAQFNAMQEFIRQFNKTRIEYGNLTDALQDIYGIDAPVYFYSNEINMINKLATGKSTKQLRAEHNLETGASIRPYLSPSELTLLEHLQRYDISLLQIFKDYKDRKQRLTEFAEQFKAQTAAKQNSLSSGGTGKADKQPKK